MSTVAALKGDSPNAPLFVSLLELFYLNKLIRQHIIKLLPRAARGPSYFVWKLIRVALPMPMCCINGDAPNDPPLETSRYLISVFSARSLER